jgi:hypothetical protein
VALGELIPEQFLERASEDVSGFSADLAAARVGLTLDRTTPPAGSDYDKFAAQRAVLAIAESDCGEDPVLSGTPQGTSVRGRNSCRTLSPSQEITAVAGSILELDGSKAYDATRAACAKSAEIEVTVFGRPDPLRIRCTTRLAERPPYLRLRDWRPSQRATILLP